ncbi:MAG: DUF1800 family protein [Solirubrobacteraceae bacterium]|nr:DUF1800 family protein [Solirubrobacteraceae bacterium]
MASSRSSRSPKLGRAGAQRLLWRAGTGPGKGDLRHFGSMTVDGAVDQLLHPKKKRLTGPAPSGAFLVGGNFAPADEWGHLHLLMLDRMVRSTDPLGERMTLVLHDWFGVSQSGSDVQHMPAHIALLRNGWRGSFRKLLKRITVDPSMLMFLGGTSNRMGAPNENYARELMELFTLGADRGAYSESDVRELARCLTGWRNDWGQNAGAYNFRFDPAFHDAGKKELFKGRSWKVSGRLGWEDAVDAVVDHPMHATFVAEKLWSYFIPTPPSPPTVQELARTYRRSGEHLLPVVRAILRHRRLHDGDSMVIPPAVWAAGLLKARGRGIDTEAWTWRLADAGQMLGQPPSVAGWDDEAWLSTSAYSARWGIAIQAAGVAPLKAADYDGMRETPSEAIDRAIAFWGNPEIAPPHRKALSRVAAHKWPGHGPLDKYGSEAAFNATRQNTLRQVLVAAPDFQVC